MRQVSPRARGIQIASDDIASMCIGADARNKLGVAYRERDSSGIVMRAAPAQPYGSIMEDRPLSYLPPHGFFPRGTRATALPPILTSGLRAVGRIAVHFSACQYNDRQLNYISRRKAPICTCHRRNARGAQSG